MKINPALSILESYISYNMKQNIGVRPFICSVNHVHHEQLLHDTVSDQKFRELYS